MVEDEDDDDEDDEGDEDEAEGVHTPLTLTLLHMLSILAYQFVHFSSSVLKLALF